MLKQKTFCQALFIGMENETILEQNMKIFLGNIILLNIVFKIFIIINYKVWNN